MLFLDCVADLLVDRVADLRKKKVRKEIGKKRWMYIPAR